MSNPNWPEGSSPFPGSSQQPADPNLQPGQQPPFISQPAQPGGYPYSQPAAPSQPFNPYGQPAQPAFDPNAAPAEQTQQPELPSQPLYPYGQPAAPSQPLYPYGQPAAPSQPLNPYGQYGQPSQTLPGQPGQFGPPSQALPGGMPMAQSRGMPRGLIIGSIVALVILLLAGSGTAFAVTQVQPAAANAAAKFCTALKSQDYTTAYSELSAKLKGQYSQTQFTQDMSALDKADGSVTTCQQSSGSNAYTYSLGSSTATDLILIARGSNSLQGLVHMTNAGNLVSANWKVDAIDTSLLGVNLKALEATTAFCAALQNKDYTTAFTSFGIPPTSLKTVADFKDSAALWDQIDGAITACSVSGLGSSNDDASASLNISVTRAKSGAHSSAIALNANGTTWKISSLDAAVFGTDVGAARTATLFCADLSSGKYADAYALLSSGFVGSSTESEIVDAFSGKADGIKWSGCTVDVSTYHVSGSSASISVKVTLVLVATGQSASGPVELSLVKSGDTWKIDNLKLM
ncbi:MAG TPA: hypothetical protein VF510_26430 [Ktedonobacterales bacterium]